MSQEDAPAADEEVAPDPAYESTNNTNNHHTTDPPAATKRDPPAENNNNPAGEEEEESKKVVDMAETATDATAESLSAADNIKADATNTNNIVVSSTRKSRPPYKYDPNKITLRFLFANKDGLTVTVECKPSDTVGEVKGALISVWPDGELLVVCLLACFDWCFAVGLGRITRVSNRSLFLILYQTCRIATAVRICDSSVWAKVS